MIRRFAAHPCGAVIAIAMTLVDPLCGPPFEPEVLIPLPRH